MACEHPGCDGTLHIVWDGSDSGYKSIAELFAADGLYPSRVSESGHYSYIEVRWSEGAKVSAARIRRGTEIRFCASPFLVINPGDSSERYLITPPPVPGGRRQPPRFAMESDLGPTITWDGSTEAYASIRAALPDARLHRPFRRGGHITEGGGWEDTERQTGALRLSCRGIKADLPRGARIRIEDGSFAILPPEDPP